MTPELFQSLLPRLQQGATLTELHHAAQAGGSAWSEAQLALLLACLPAVEVGAEGYHLREATPKNPLLVGLLSVATLDPLPAAALLPRLPRGLVATPAVLCELARNCPELEFLPGNRIRRR